MRTMTKTFYYLIYAGTIPFILCSICFSAGIKSIYLLGSVDKILSAYGLVILSFLSGSHWGQHLYINRRIWGCILPVLSNIIAVLLCFSFLVLSFKGAGSNICCCIYFINGNTKMGLPMPGVCLKHVRKNLLENYCLHGTHHVLHLNFVIA